MYSISTVFIDLTRILGDRKGRGQLSSEQLNKQAFWLHERKNIFTKNSIDLGVTLGSSANYFYLNGNEN